MNWRRRANFFLRLTTMKLFSLLEFVAELPAIERDLEAAGPKIIERACQIVQKKAKSAIGKEHEMWAPLAESTIADKAHHGFPTPKPLLRTGQLRDSIQYTVNGLEGAVGSDSPIAVWQELGTSHIPPRSFLAGAAIHMEDKIHKMAAQEWDKRAGFTAIRRDAEVAMSAEQRAAMQMARTKPRTPAGALLTYTKAKLPTLRPS
jgi:HK97 gp10 family phage protein